jgi:hypothetical protein
MEQLIGSSNPPPRVSSVPPPPPIVVRSEPPSPLAPGPRRSPMPDAPPLPDAIESSEPPPDLTSSTPPRRPSTAPERPSTRPRHSSSPADFEPEPSLPAPVPLGFGVEPEGGPMPRQIPQSEMSPELEMLLARAEQRLSDGSGSSGPPSGRMSPEEEVEAVLPADVLAALDEPLDLEDDDQGSEAEGLSGTRSGSEARTGTGHGAGTYSGALLGTSAGTVAGPLSTALPQIAPPQSSRPEPWLGQPTSGMQTTAPPGRGTGVTSERSAASTAPPQMGIRDSEPPPPVGTSSVAGQAAVTAVESLPDRQPAQPPRIFTGDLGAEPMAPSAGLQRAPLDAARFGPPTVAEPVIHNIEDHALPSPPPAAPEPPARAAPAPEIPTAIGRGDGLRALARCVRARYTGAIAFEAQAEIRRVVLRDGDFVTASSGAQGESLLAFLAARGMLPADAATRLGHRLPQFGRHAGAALIAHGHLRQDELWPVLRAHAEWIVGHVIAMTGGASSLEPVPPRLQAEPAVFGGATGAEVLTEVVRRVVPPGEAIARLGGGQARLAEGPAPALLGECALPEHETALVNRAKSCTVQEVLDSAGGEGFASALYALRELGVLEILSPARGGEESAPLPHDQLDDDAIRERIRARKALVDEGDYFALLGLPRSATAYDIRRAYLELRREFEPSRILTAATADLRDDTQVVIEVLDEAYEILREERRRERYRRALEAAPR